ncbi:hypothetical protein ACX0G9_03510 [Flavitalea flava]
MKHYQLSMGPLALLMMVMTVLWATGQMAQQNNPENLQISQVNRQIPKGFKKGMATLKDNTVLSGYIREHIRTHSSVLFVPAIGGKRKELDGEQLRSLQIDSIRYLCLKGDFFRVITDGEIGFLQKCSDASGKPVYNGTEPLLINGTEGSIGDYFVFNNGQGQLSRVTRKTLGKVARDTFGNCTAAIDKADSVHSDMAGFRNAVELYNNRTKTTTINRFPL